MAPVYIGFVVCFLSGSTWILSTRFDNNFMETPLRPNLLRTKGIDSFFYRPSTTAGLGFCPGQARGGDGTRRLLRIASWLRIDQFISLSGPSSGKAERISTLPTPFNASYLLSILFFIFLHIDKTKSKLFVLRLLVVWEREREKSGHGRSYVQGHTDTYTPKREINRESDVLQLLTLPTSPANGTCKYPMSLCPRWWHLTTAPAKDHHRHAWQLASGIRLKNLTTSDVYKPWHALWAKNRERIIIPRDICLKGYVSKRMSF